jgi:ribonucleotide reductase alpha subunit
MSLTFDSHAEAIAKRQYLLEGERGILDMFRRVAREIAKVERPEDRPLWEERFFDLMASKRFSPGGRILAGAGTEHGNLLNCFVQGATENPPHTLEGIEEVALKLALVTKVGGGNGINLDPYLPRQRQEPRPVQGIAYLSADHPDAEDFIRGLMVPSHTPDGPKQAFQMRYWKRVVYGAASEALKALARDHGVEVVPVRPADGIHQVEDEMEAIVRAGFWAVRRVLKGEVPQLDLSRLRPLGSPVRRSGGTASGPVSFLIEFYENFLRFASLGAEKAGPVAVLRYVYAPLLRGVKQGGVRRGAGMATLSATHPDLLDFMTAKDPNREQAEGPIDTFNISVLVSDDLVEAYEEDALIPWVPNPVPGKYALREVEGPYRGEWPEESEEGLRAIPLFQGGVPARWLMRELAWHAWLSGDPGVIFVDRINDLSALKGLGPRYQIRSTNPCLAGNTPVLTLDGLVPVKKLAEEGYTFLVHAYDGGSFQVVPARAFKTRDAAPTMTVYYSDRDAVASITCTPDHPFLVFRERWEDAKWVQAKDLLPGDRLIPAPKSLLPEEAVGGESYNHEVLEVKEGPVLPVYDVRTDTGTLLAGSLPVVVHNCGEIPLTVGEPCDLGALNLAAYVKDGEFQMEEFRRDVHTAIRFLDNVLDVNRFALPDNEEAAKKLRRLGLGVMGLADALIKMGLPYSSEEAREKVYEIMSAMREEAIKASEALAKERGVFPLYEAHQEYFEALGIRPRRNVALLTVAPTGTTSMVMGVSSGIEPVFSPFVWRRIGGEYKPLLHPLFVELMEQYPPAPGYEKEGKWDWDKVIAAIQEDGHGSVKNLPFVPESIRQVFECAHDIHPLDHVRMQGAVQRAFDAEGYAGNSISKTVNLPNGASVLKVEAAYLEAYRTGCKGITVYRDGSKEFQVLTVRKEEAKMDKAGSKQEAPLETPRVGESLEAKKALPAQPSQPIYERPGRLFGFTDMAKLLSPEGRKESFLVTVNMLEGRPIEVILTTGKAGDEANADSEALGRVVSIALQYGVPPEAIVRTLRGINGGLYGTYQGRLVSSKADLIAVALETIPEVLRGQSPAGAYPGAAPGSWAEPVPGGAAEVPALSGGGLALAGATKCPSCGEVALVREEGCFKCQVCGYSKCG